MVAIVILTSEPHEYFTLRAQSHNELVFFLIQKLPTLYRFPLDGTSPIAI